MPGGGGGSRSVVDGCGADEVEVGGELLGGIEVVGGVLLGAALAVESGKAVEKELGEVAEGDGVAAGEAFAGKLADQIAEEGVDGVGCREVVDAGEEVSGEGLGIGLCGLGFAEVVGTEAGGGVRGHAAAVVASVDVGAVTGRACGDWSYGFRRHVRVLSGMEIGNCETRKWKLEMRKSETRNWKIENRNEELRNSKWKIENRTEEARWGKSECSRRRQAGEERKSRSPPRRAGLTRRNRGFGMRVWRVAGVPPPGFL